MHFISTKAVKSLVLAEYTESAPRTNLKVASYSLLVHGALFV
jgi:hypothetical protein